MSATAGQADEVRGGVDSPAERLGIRPGMVVMEMNADDDVDAELREAVAELSGNELVDEESDEVVDAVLLWWRDGDGDLVDALIGALGPLADAGVVWLLSPKSGRANHVAPSDISESAPTAGLQQTSTISASRDWAGARLVTPKAARSKR